MHKCMCTAIAPQALLDKDQQVLAGSHELWAGTMAHALPLVPMLAGK